MIRTNHRPSCLDKIAMVTGTDVFSGTARAGFVTFWRILAGEEPHEIDDIGGLGQTEEFSIILNNTSSEMGAFAPRRCTAESIIVDLPGKERSDDRVQKRDDVGSLLPSSPNVCRYT